MTVFKTFSEIESTYTHSGSNAASLLRSIISFEFIFCHVLREILGLNNALNLYLQSPKIYATVKNMTNHTIESIQSYRCDSKFNDLWILTKKFL